MQKSRLLILICKHGSNEENNERAVSTKSERSKTDLNSSNDKLGKLASSSSRHGKIYVIRETGIIKAFHLFMNRILPFPNLIIVKVSSSSARLFRQNAFVDLIS